VRGAKTVRNTRNKQRRRNSTNWTSSVISHPSKNPKTSTQGEKDVTRVAKHLGGTEANASAQIKILFEAGLLECRYEPGQHGLKKISKTKVKKIIIEL